MTPDQETASMQVIEFCRDFNRRMAAKQAEIGATAEDIAIAAIYSALDLAQQYTGDPVSAVAWLRRALDTMETDHPHSVETIQ